MKDNNLYIKHILDSISRIEKFVGEASLDDFMANEMMQSAVVFARTFG